MAQILSYGSKGARRSATQCGGLQNRRMRRDPQRIRSSDRLLGSPTFRAAGITLIALQLLAFWMVCSQQMDQAQARRMALQVQQTAFSDCLQYVVGSTIGTCTSWLGRSDGTSVPENAAAPQAGAGNGGSGTPTVSVATR